MSDLRQRAHASVNGKTAIDSDDPMRLGAALDEPTDLVPFAELDEATSDDPPKVSVFVAWARVMRDVQGVAKRGLYNQGGTRYNFRGIDAMLAAFGPAVRRHGVMVIPIKVTPSHAPATSSKGTAMRETTTVVTFRVYGPDGTYFDGEAEGECLDVSDKGSVKAQSVALRAFLIAAGMVPTDEPDPDTSHHERGERPLPKASEYVEEICSPRTSFNRIRQIRVEVARHQLLGAIVTNETGDEEKLGDLIKRIGDERLAQEGGQQ